AFPLQTGLVILQYGLDLLVLHPLLLRYLLRRSIRRMHDVDPIAPSKLLMRKFDDMAMVSDCISVALQITLDVVDQYVKLRGSIKFRSHYVMIPIPVVTMLIKQSPGLRLMLIFMQSLKISPMEQIIRVCS